MASLPHILLIAAINKVREGHMSRHAASKAYGVPRSTLRDKLDGKRPEDRKMGTSTVLTKAEEAMLAAVGILYQVSEMWLPHK